MKDLKPIQRIFLILFYGFAILTILLILVSVIFGQGISNAIVISFILMVLFEFIFLIVVD